MSRPQQERNGSPDAAALHRQKVIKTAAEVIRGTSSFSPHSFESNYALVRSRVTKGSFNLIHSLEQAGKLSIDELGRTKLSQGMQPGSDAYMLVHELSGFNVHRVSLDKLYKSYVTIRPRLIANALLHGESLEVKDIESYETAFRALMLSGVPSSQQEFFSAAIDLERELHDPVIGIVSEQIYPDYSPNRLEVVSGEKGTSIILVEAASHNEAERVMRTVNTVPLTTEPEIAQALNQFGSGTEFSVKLSRGRRRRMRVNGKQPVERLLFEVMNSEQFQAMPVGSDTSIGIIAIGNIDISGGGMSVPLIAGKLGGTVAGIHTKSEISSEEETTQFNHPFAPERPNNKQSQRALTERNAVDIVALRVNSDSYAYMLSLNMV